MTPHRQSEYSEEQENGGTEPEIVISEHFSSYQVFEAVTLRQSYTSWRSSDTGSGLHSLGTQLPRSQLINEWLCSIQIII